MGYMRVFVAGVIWLVFAQVSAAKGLERLPYTSLQVSHTWGEADDPDFDFEGNSITVVLDTGSNVLIFGGYGSAKTDDFPGFGTRGFLMGSVFDMGLGYHYPLSPKIDLVPSISLSDTTTEFKGGFSGIPEENDTTWSYKLAVRALVTPHIELAGGVDYDGDDDESLFQVGVHYYPTNRFNLGVVYGFRDDVKGWELVGKMFFG